MLNPEELAIMVRKASDNALIHKKEFRAYEIRRKNCCGVQVEKEVFADFGIPTDTEAYSDWLSKNHFRMSNGRKFITLTNQV